MIFKKYKKQLALSSFVILLPIAVGLVLWNILPDVFATHWGVDGQADGWSGKAFAIFFTPLFLLGMHLFCVWITELTNRGNEQSSKVMNLIFCVVPVISLLSNGMVYAIALGKSWNFTSLMPITLGCLFALIGNYLPKCTQNATVGIKVAWTLSNEENWNATHRFAGKLWFAAGIVCVVCGFAPSRIGYPVTIIALIGCAFGSILYSYLYYRKQLKEGTATPLKKIPVDHTTKIIYRAVRIFTIILLIGIGFLLFSGSIEYEFREDALVMDATFSSPITLRYETIENIEYREGHVDGTRIGGIGSFRLLLGLFENEEFGTYSRYTYYKPDSCIVVTTKGRTLVFSGVNAAETLELYNTLITRIK